MQIIIHQCIWHYKVLDIGDFVKLLERLAGVHYPVGCSSFHKYVKYAVEVYTKHIRLEASTEWTSSTAEWGEGGISLEHGMAQSLID